MCAFDTLPAQWLIYCLMHCALVRAKQAREEGVITVLTGSELPAGGTDAQLNQEQMELQESLRGLGVIKQVPSTSEQPPRSSRHSYHVDAATHSCMLSGQVRAWLLPCLQALPPAAPQLHADMGLWPFLLTPPDTRAHAHGA